MAKESEVKKLLCPECSKEVDASAAECGCGAPIGAALKFNRLLNLAEALRTPKKKKEPGFFDSIFGIGE